MLIRFVVENVLSFRDRTELSMIGTREQQHNERVPRFKKHRLKVLPVAALYGGNASGKTNFVKALDFAHDFIVLGRHSDKPIPVIPFKLGPPDENRPSRFEFELIIDEEIYSYRFAVTKRNVVEERLALLSGAGEKVLFERGEDNKLNFLPRLREKDEFLKFAEQGRGIRNNQLFLTTAMNMKVELNELNNLYKWFSEFLFILSPGSYYAIIEAFFDHQHSLHADINHILSLMDTGIVHLDGEEVPLDSIPASEREEVLQTLNENSVARVFNEEQEQVYVVSKENGNVVAKKAVACHRTADGKEVRLDLNEESDGTLRILNLLPAFLGLSEPDSKRVFVIDELDRSLHSLLTRRLLEMYLEHCGPDTRSQLIFTTHDLLLMDQRLFRRDEMWLAEREDDGASILFSFGDFADVRFDKDIRKSYLQGRMGGIPRLSSCALGTPSCRAEKKQEE